MTSSSADAFVTVPPAEETPEVCFDHDRGVLEPHVRRALALIMQRRFIARSAHPTEWATILEEEAVLQSRLNDMFLTLVIDRNYEVIYKEQVRLDGIHVPILLRDEPYRRVEAVLLVQARALRRRATLEGSTTAVVDSEDLVDLVQSFFDTSDTNLAGQQNEIKAGIAQLTREGVFSEVGSGRLVVSPVVDIIVPVERLRELSQWCEQDSIHGTVDAADDEHEEGQDDVH